MQFSIEKILLFNIIKITLNPKKNRYDNHIIKIILNQAKQIASNVNQKSANNSNKLRERDSLITDNFIGVLSEYSWKIAINALLVHTTVKECESLDMSNQIDLKTLKGNYNIEVRASFVRNGIKFALDRSKYPFDIIGPYINEYKSEEKPKDFYLRCLYHFNNQNKSDFIYTVNHQGIHIYLVGGASLEMMQDENLYVIKTMKKGSELGYHANGVTTQYKAISIPKAKDALSIIKEIYKKTCK